MADTGGIDVQTFGCRLNLVESEAIRRAVRVGGRDNLVVINTCAVTGEAVRQARQAIRRARRDRPEAEIVVTGCAAETETATFAAMPDVSRIIGNAFKTRPETWASADERSPLTGIGDIRATRDSPPPLAEIVSGHTRGFVQVQTGCDHSCTFCIIPFGRGQARSVPGATIIDTIARLVDQGIGDVVLTGVDLTSFGNDLPEKPRLGTLVRHILRAVPTLRRLRLSSIDSIEADADLMRALAEEDRLMPHLHLSLQSGDDLILKRMKRRHAAADAVAFCAEARRLRPDIVFGADFIAGFPTETDAMFANSLSHVDACDLTHLHVFPFSPRAGTPAARMPQVPPDVARARAARLRELGDRTLAAHLDRQIGRQLEFLVENGGVGRAADFTPAHIAPEHAAGDWISATVSGHDGRRLIVDAHRDPATSGLVAAAATG